MPVFHPGCYGNRLTFVKNLKGLAFFLIITCAVGCQQYLAVGMRMPNRSCFWLKSDLADNAIGLWIRKPQ